MIRRARRPRSAVHVACALAALLALAACSSAGDGAPGALAGSHAAGAAPPSGGAGGEPGPTRGAAGANGDDDAAAAPATPVDAGAPPTADAGSTPPPVDAGAGAGAADGMTDLQKHKAEMLTSIWENGTTVLQYPYCENIKDGRGYTSGRAGFCSGTGDAIQVVACFDKAFGAGAANLMAKYMPALTAIDGKFESTGKDQGDTSPLDAVGSYCGDWAKTANDAATAPAFKACQDQIVDALYYAPALAQANRWGLTTALTKAELYDAEINHGDDGVAALVKQANADVGNGAQKPPSAALSRAAESAWLHAFLLRRLALLQSDATWASSEDRVVTYEQLRLQGNFDLSAPIETNAKAIKMYPGKGYQDSGYPDCTISASGVASGDASCTSPTGQ